MGGPGSGNRWRTAGRPSTNEFRSLDVRWLARKGLLKPTGWSTLTWSREGREVASVRVRGDHGCVHLWYRHRRSGGEWQTESYTVRVARTACHMGGTRSWFICPAARCGRRVAVLFGGEVFACRHCYRIAYASTRESADERVVRRADKVRTKLGWESGILNGEGDKPKWMRRKTFGRLVREHDALVVTSLTGWHKQITRAAKL